MRNDIDFIDARQKPVFLKETKRLIQYIKTLSQEQVKTMLVCSDTIAKQAYQTYQHMDVHHNVCPALLAYEGIQFTYMAPHVFFDDYYEYVEEHVRILSGLYGILRPFDGVVPYRLELNNKFSTPFCTSLYDFWKDNLYMELCKDGDDIILDLASVQCSKIIKKYVTPNVLFVKCCFMEDEDGILREKGVYVKMARGEMVRYLTEIKATTLAEVKTFSRLHYGFRKDLSSDTRYVFTREATRSIADEDGNGWNKRT